MNEANNPVALLGIAGIGETDKRFNAVARKVGRNVTPAERQTAVAYAKEVAKPAFDRVLDKNQLLFWGKKEAVLTSDEQTSFANGQFELRDFVHFLRTTTGTSGIQELMTSATKELAGICSFANQAVTNAFQITGIAVGYGEGVSASVNAGSIKYQYDLDVPAAIQHATLVISQASGGEIMRVHLNRLFQRNSGTGKLDDHILYLTAPKYLRTDSAIKMQLIYPDGVTNTPITTDYFPYLSIELIGNELGPKPVTR